MYVPERDSLPERWYLVRARDEEEERAARLYWMDPLVAINSGLGVEILAVPAE